MREARYLAVLIVVLLMPTRALAQASVTGVVRDSSGGVMPGVTVEAASPVLIEKVRATITDSAGLYRIVDLRPGTYTLTFSLPGFATVRREGLELAGSVTLTIPAEMRVGSLQETLTVTGATPVVDVQNARTQTVLNADVIAALPATRAYGSLLNAIPGLTVDNNGLADHADDDVLQLPRRPEQRRQSDDQRPGRRRGIRRRRRRDVHLRHQQRRGDVGAGRGRVGRVRDRRAGDELRAALGRQRLLGTVVLQHRRQVVERRQPRRLRCAASASGRPAASSAPTMSAARSAGRSSATSCGSSAATASCRPRRASKASSATPTRSTRRTGTTSGMTASRCATCRAARSIRRGSPAQVTQKNRVTFSQQNEYRCQGSTATLSGEGCRAPRRRLDGDGIDHAVARGQRPILRFPVLADAGDLDVDGDQPAAARGRRQPARVSRWSGHRTAGRGEEPDSGRRAGGDRRPPGQFRLPRHQHRGRQLPEHQELARLGVLRDRRAQPEGRLPGRLSTR